ncbi:MAG: UDP-N-acetylmuramoyl-L-alanyl-D-glutamate--2,6-diaminopimelate ligase [Alphaproteobacteria bacterium]|jgi:UDP-N-acetylmuramoyl-L-alanyl-D-glutamate--2,6-diaminopimelate ligase
MKLSELLDKKIENDCVVTDVKDDSRQLVAGDIFVFDRRVSDKGEAFVAQARKAGVTAIITNLDVAGDDIYTLENPFDAMARFAQNKYPQMPAFICGVTGTNGKTSVAWFYNCILRGAGKNVASIGTLGIYLGTDLLAETGYTSPTPLVLHKHLHDLAKKGVTHLCMEVSSHALDLHRAHSVPFKAAAFTNISPDHRDYHGSMEAYMFAKQALFTECLQDKGSAVLNILHPASWPLASICKQLEMDVLTVGAGQAELVVKQKSLSAAGMLVEIKYNTHVTEITLPLVGAFQAENMAVAIGLALKSGLSWAEIEKGLGAVTSVPGRMEMIVEAGKPLVVVDYAHTPDALKTAITAIRPQVKGKLWTVFGCGGDRDKTKRAEMGKIATDLSDMVIVTDDNPRTEDAALVRKDIMQACPDALECGDRSKAIQLAIEKASVDDVILLAGKGHESGQYINGEVVAFDDRDQAKRYLRGA